LNTHKECHERDPAAGPASWMGGASIAAGALLLVTTEFLPIGMLSPIVAGFRVTEGMAGLLVILAQVRLLPRLPTIVPINVARLMDFARVPMARIGLIASGFAAAGHFIAYTFLEPYLRDSLAFGPSGVALALTGYAVAGIAGAFAGEHLATRNIRRALAVSSAAVGLFVVAAATFAGAPTAAVIMVMLWGFAFGAVPVCVQVWMFTSSPRLYEAGSALMVSAFQIALAAGAAIGGLLVDSSGIGAAFLVAGVVCVAGAFVPLLSRAPDVTFSTLPPR
jgi:predicted MFS family arabinose efflux permease